MKKLLFSTSIAAIFMVATAFMPPPAVVTDSHNEYDIAGNFPNNCNGETISYTGTVVEDVHSVINNNKANLNIKIKVKLDGVGDQGNTYVGFQNVTYNLTVPITNGAYSANQIVNLHFTSKGSAPNVVVKYRIKITVNANGDITVQRFDIESSCL